MLATIKAEFPAWHPWLGVTGVCYARLPRSSPPVVVRAHNWTVLARRIRVREAAIRRRMEGLSP